MWYAYLIDASILVTLWSFYRRVMLFNARTDLLSERRRVFLEFAENGWNFDQPAYRAWEAEVNALARNIHLFTPRGVRTMEAISKALGVSANPALPPRRPCDARLRDTLEAAHLRAARIAMRVLFFGSLGGLWMFAKAVTSTLMRRALQRNALRPMVLATHLGLAHIVTIATIADRHTIQRPPAVATPLLREQTSG